MNAIIFTDGSSRGNPGPGGWGAIIADDSLVTELGGREDHTTNNRMELMAIISALSNTTASHVTLYTDSQYVISGITLWISSWKKNNWKTKTKEDVLNKDLWEKLDALKEAKEVTFKKVDGHHGIPANERCDEIATSCADNLDPHLFRGPRETYPIDLTITSGNSSRTSSKKTGPTYSYVSSVGGVIQVHAKWEECKARVHGVKGARYKKAQSKSDEGQIIKEFSQR